MKARLIDYRGDLQLLLCTGKVLDVTPSQAIDFLLNYDDPKFYQGTGTWNYPGVSMESFRGSTIATVDDLNVLHIQDGIAYRKIMAHYSINYISAKDYGEKHGVKSANIRKYCIQGRIAGVIMIGRTYMIPENATYPEDERARSK